MNTIVRIVNEENINMDYINEAGEILRNGGLVAFPTETVYGLGGNALDKDASAKIYAAKGRPSDNPLIAHISNEAELEPLVSYIPECARKLMKAFWPGPLTMVFKKSDIVPYETTGGLETVAVRMPSHKVALAMISQAGVPIAAPSANTSGRPSPTLASHVVEDLDGKVDMIIDGGKVGIGIESTIVDVTTEIPMILRPGFITKKMIEQVIGEVSEDKVVSATDISVVSDDSYTPKAPGMKYKHYAPQAELTMYEGDVKAVIATINEVAKMNRENGVKVGVIATEETKEMYNADYVVSIGTRQDEASIARGLYEVLRSFDATDVGVILSETFYEDELGCSVMNRLIKAAGYRLVKVGNDEIQ